MTKQANSQILHNLAEDSGEDLAADLEVDLAADSAAGILALGVGFAKIAWPLTRMATSSGEKILKSRSIC